MIESPDINHSTPTSSSASSFSGHMTSIAPPTTQHPLEPIPELGDALDSTLVSENIDKGHQSPPTLCNPAIPAVHVASSSSSVQTSSALDDLTPLITFHSPFPAKFDVPKLDFANASATSRHTISPISGSQPQSKGISTSLRNSSPLLQKFSKTSPLPHGVGEVSSVGLPSELLKPTVADDSTTSTLVLKEVSTLSLSSPPSVLDPSLMSNMPTPSIAKLPSFDITEMTHTQHFGSFSSLRDVTSSDLGLDHSLQLQSRTSPGKSNVFLSEHAKSTATPAKLVAGITTASVTSPGLSSPSKLVENHLSLAGVASSTATTKVSKGHSSSPSKFAENPMSAAKKASPAKVTFSPKRPLPVITSTSEGVQVQTSPGRYQVTQVLSTETLTTWSSNSPLTSPPPGLKSPPLPPQPMDRNLSTKNAPTSTPPRNEPGTVPSSGVRSPNTEAAREKLASLQAKLDAARFNADEFLANLKSGGDDGPPSSSPGKSTPVSTSKSSTPTKTSRAAIPSTSSSPKSKASLPSSHSGAKKSSTSSISRPSKPFMSMPANSSTSKKRGVAAVCETSTSTSSPEKGKRESASQATKFDKASTELGESDQLSSKCSPSRKKPHVGDTPTKGEAGQLHKAIAKDPGGSSTLSPSSKAKRSSPSKVVKSPRVHTKASSTTKKRHVHIQEPQSSLPSKSSVVKKSTMMSSGGGSPHKLNMHSATSSTVDTLSSTKFTLSSLLTSHAHTSPPPLSTLTMSASPSPSPQGHSPPPKTKTLSSTASSCPSISTPSDISTRLSPPGSESLSSQPALITKPLTKGPTPHAMKLVTSTVDSSVIKVPDSLCFSQSCCVGVSSSDQLMITNLSERWLQLEFRLTHLYRDGTEVNYLPCLC